MNSVVWRNLRTGTPDGETYRHARRFGTGRVERVARHQRHAQLCGMAHTYLSMRVHLVWATRQREKWLDPEWRPRLYACTSRIVSRAGSRLLCAGGVRDHVHLYVDLGARLALSDLVSAVKAGTSRWIHETYSHRRAFRWQEGYGAFTVTTWQDARLRDHILDQERHHAEVSFTTEYSRLLSQHGIVPDPRDALD
jgi:REP-associated tyrosine transposase